MILVLDNRDSYTYNLVQLLRRDGREVRVVEADAGGEALELLASGAVSGVVVSPGPGHPDRPDDFAASGALIDAVLALADPAHPSHRVVPVLGVCLGHQGLARRFGYQVVPAPEPRHGWLSPLEHTGDGLFEGVPQGTRVTRYHSLQIVAGPRPDPALRVTARSEDGVIQAFEIAGRPWFGVQFHPESIASERGADLVATFVGVVDRVAPVTHVAVRELALAPGVALTDAARALAASWVRRGTGSFWLDSAIADADGTHWSLVGDAVDATGDALAGVFRFRDGWLEVDRWPDADADAEARAGAVAHADALRRTSRPCADVFGALGELGARGGVEGGEALPFRGGLVGFLGYELGLRDLGVAPERIHPATTPDAAWVRPSRFAVIDHVAATVRVAVVSTDRQRAEQAVEREAARAAGVVRAAPALAPREGDGDDGAERLANGRWRDDRAGYAAKIEACRAALRAGDAYELCLTTSFEVDAGLRIDPLELFADLIRHHPTPYAALLELDDGGDALAIVSASPERFLRGRSGQAAPDDARGTGGVYETKPIKGTARRDPDPVVDREIAASLATDPKTFAENLMIVDLLRNDLGRVCVPGTVEVPALMRVETYASVHQLVSTIRGVAEPGTTPVDVVRALFPGGSMTGAPKRRSVELLADLEGRARGVYSGVLGVLGDDGRTELSIVIRTGVRSRGRWTIGAGGAIVLDSDPEAETDEVELKASAMRGAMARVAR